MHTPFTLGVSVAAVISTSLTLLVVVEDDMVRDLAKLGYLTGLLCGIALVSFYGLARRLDRVETTQNRAVAVERDVLLTLQSSHKLN